MQFYILLSETERYVCFSLSLDACASPAGLKPAEKMFVVRLSWRCGPASGVTLPFGPRVQHVHKLASLQKVPTMPPKKLQNLLYPFSQLESYLDRCLLKSHLYFIAIQQEWNSFIHCNATFQVCGSDPVPALPPQCGGHAESREALLLHVPSH